MSFNENVIKQIIDVIEPEVRARSNIIAEKARTKQMRQMVMDYNHNRCCACGSQSTNSNPLDCHHLRYPSHTGYNERLCDMTVLCRACHERHHVATKNDPKQLALVSPRKIRVPRSR